MSHSLALPADSLKPLVSEAARRTACVIWLTGLHGVGKAAIAQRVERHLSALGRSVMLLNEEPTRAGEMAKLLYDAGLIVIAAQVSPTRAERGRLARQLPSGRFLEIHLTSAAADRDPAYEPPLSPTLSLRTDRLSVEEAAVYVVQSVVGWEWRPD